MKTIMHTMKCFVTRQSVIGFSFWKRGFAL